MTLNQQDAFAELRRVARELLGETILTVSQQNNTILAVDESGVTVRAKTDGLVTWKLIESVVDVLLANGVVERETLKRDGVQGAYRSAFIIAFLARTSFAEYRDGKLRLVTETSRPARNPNWAREELILALDLYMKHRPSLPGKNSGEVVELSATLNRLAQVLGLVAGDSRFRNEAGVYMKLMNFLPLDPTYIGAGLSAGGALDASVWNEFADKPHELRKQADAIRRQLDLAKTTALLAGSADDESAEFSEGRVAERLHKSRERNPAVAKTKKQQALKKFGRLSCEVCDFDFAAVYGTVGEGFIEAHHLLAVSEWPDGERKTKLDDVALVCSNCHRMLHRTKPWPNVEDLRTVLSNSMTT